MSRMHILQQTSPNLYQVVVHAPTPVANNSAGVSWATSIANSGPPVSSLPIGNGPGQISSSEANQVAAGSVIETFFQWQDDPNWTNPQRLADLSLRADLAVADAIAEMQVKLKQFGRTVT